MAENISTWLKSAQAKTAPIETLRAAQEFLKSSKAEMQAGSLKVEIAKEGAPGQAVEPTFDAADNVTIPLQVPLKFNLKRMALRQQTIARREMPNTPRNPSR